MKRYILFTLFVLGSSSCFIQAADQNVDDSPNKNDSPKEFFEFIDKIYEKDGSEMTLRVLKGIQKKEEKEINQISNAKTFDQFPKHMRNDKQWKEFVTKNEGPFPLVQWAMLQPRIARFKDLKNKIEWVKNHPREGTKLPKTIEDLKKEFTQLLTTKDGIDSDFHTYMTKKIKKNECKINQLKQCTNIADLFFKEVDQKTQYKLMGLMSQQNMSFEQAKNEVVKDRQKFSQVVSEVFKEFEAQQTKDKKAGSLKVCAHCNVSELDKKLRICAACKQVRYCSRQCQLADWKKQHRKECKK